MLHFRSRIKVFSLMLHLSTLVAVLLTTNFSFTESFLDFETPDNSSIVYTYTRFSEIKNKCGSVLQSASYLEPDDDRGSRLKHDLSFLNGDWYQEPEAARLLPFINQLKHMNSGSFFKLASFWLSDVDPIRRSKNMVSISAVMEIGISASHLLNYKPFNWLPEFRMSRGKSVLTILLEGVYIETEENTLMCLLGTATRPTTSQVEETKHEFSDHEEIQLPLVNDDQIMLVLRYPKIISLVDGHIYGEMTSLHEKGDSKYFDKIRMSSQLGSLRSRYQFGAEELLSKACSPYPYPDNSLEEELMLFKGDNFCEKFYSYFSNQIFNFVPNNDGTLGPFFGIKDGSLANYRLLLHHLHCEEAYRENIQVANVSALFRVINSWEKPYEYEDRTGVSGMTLSAEGVWKSSGGQICMVGCLGINRETSKRCDSRICLYLPLTFSIKSRSMALGSITVINETKLQDPVLFELATRPTDVFRRYKWESLKWSYNCSKTTQVRTTNSFLQNSLFLYASINDSAPARLSRLAQELSFRQSALPFSFYNTDTQKVDVELEILSFGSLVGDHWKKIGKCDKLFSSDNRTIEVSGLISLKGAHFDNLSLSFEGVYDPVVGEMYLVGCRDVREFPDMIRQGTNIERGMDCLFDIKIKYPPKNARWLIIPTIKISISNKRSKQDPLYFTQIKLKSNPLSYKKQLRDTVLRKTCDGVVRILLLVSITLCILRQLLYTAESAAYVSLVMLGIQALGYAIPLITGNEPLIRSEVLDSQDYELRFLFLERATKTLLLIALFLTLRLYQKVLDVRIKQLSLTSKQKSRVMIEKKVWLITIAVHLFWFLMRVMFDSNNDERASKLSESSYGREHMKLLKWLVDLDDYGGLVQDLFLLPQIVSNSLWQVKGKSLSKSYYLGFTASRVFLQGYGFYYYNMGGVGSIFVVPTLICAALLLYVQQ